MTHTPDAIAEYFRASAEHDADAAAATFTPNATVVDDGKTYAGQAQIRSWRAQTSTEFEYTTTVLDIESTSDDAHAVKTEVAGNFPGSPVRLNFQFTLAGGLIATLVIAPD